MAHLDSLLFLHRKREGIATKGFNACSPRPPGSFALW
jgi:hypothetical protein